MADDSLALSLIIPLHNEAGTLVSLYQEIKEVLDGLGMTYEIILSMMQAQMTLQRF